MEKMEKCRCTVLRTLRIKVTLFCVFLICFFLLYRTWPREAAAKAGIKQRDSAEDIEFRRTLRGLGPDGYLISDVKIIIGTVVDAMDSAGRWYQAEIADIECYNDSGDNSDTSSDTEEEQSIDEDGRPGEIRAVKIDFRDVGGHEEWILVGSDRLAVKNRFTLDSMKSMRLEEMDNTANGKSNGETKLGLVLRRHTAKEPTPFQLSNTICSFPGFGACGLTNLGNTCYANSAIQCISYLPILRSYLLSGQFKKYGDINKDNPLGTGGKLLEEVASLQQLMWSGKNGVRSPFKFRAQLSRALQQYTGAEQQDAQVNPSVQNSKSFASVVSNSLFIFTFRNYSTICLMRYMKIAIKW